jgi:hypothetical protein
MGRFENIGVIRIHYAAVYIILVALLLRELQVQFVNDHRSKVTVSD